MNIKRGDIFFADLSPVVGSEQGGIRPVLVVQNDLGNRFSPTIIIASISVQIRKAKLPTHVALSAEQTGLEKDTTVMLEQLRTIDKSRLIDKITQLDDKLIEEVNKAYMIAGGIISISNEVHKEVENYFTYTINEEVRFEEDYCYEFKEIKGNPKNSVRNTISEYASSFLNGRGGRVLYGITNEKVVKGVVATSKDKDEIKIVIYDRLFLINPAISPDHFEINYHPVYDRDRKIIDDLYIIEVITPISPDKSAIYFVNGNELHVRLDGVKKKLIGTEIVSFIRKKINLE